MWNYRVVKQVQSDDPDGDVTYAVHQVHYRDDSDDHPESWTLSGVSPRGETREELAADLQRWLVAFTKPVLVVDKRFTGETEPPPGRS